MKTIFVSHGFVFIEVIEDIIKHIASACGHRLILPVAEFNAEGSCFATLQFEFLWFPQIQI